MGYLDGKAFSWEMLDQSQVADDASTEVDFSSFLRRLATRDKKCSALVRVRMSSRVFNPSSTQEVLFSWKAVIVSFADLEMPAMLWPSEKGGSVRGNRAQLLSQGEREEDLGSQRTLKASFVNKSKLPVLNSAVQLSVT